MLIGVPVEIKQGEWRVGLVPGGARALVEAGHAVVVERGAGAGSSIPDAAYAEAGAEVVASAEEVYARADMVVKVKEPVGAEFGFLRDGLIVFTFLHLAANRALAEALIKGNSTAIAYETVELDDGGLPILAPMSEVAGRLSVQAGAHYLMKPYGGLGLLLSGVPGVERGNVTIIGAGTVGLNAAEIAAGMRAGVTVLDVDTEKLCRFDEVFGPAVKTLISNAYNLERVLERTDLLIGAVHIPGARTPRLVTRAMLRGMKRGSVVVDVSVDQGGCIETTRPTTHSEPVYEVEGVLHYCVSNMPGAVPRTSTFALTNATLPYILKLAALGVQGAIEADAALGRGLNVCSGRVMHARVAEALDMDCEAP